MKQNKISQWIHERFPLADFLAWSLHEEIPGGTRFSYTLGSSCLFLFVIQVVSGVWQMFFYVPTVDYAYLSLNYLRFEVPFGWLIHGFHYWGAHAFTVVVGLHVIRVFIWGAYKTPRELVWLAGVGLLILTAAFMFTGPVLPWDKKGYWAAQVGLNMAGSAPGIGPWLQSVFQGASKLGQVALTRLYVIHVAILPFFTALFTVIHLVAFRVHGSVGPWREKEKKKPAGEFWPEQLFKDAIIWFAIFLLLVWLSAFVPAPVSGLADPMDTLYTPKPEWNFLFLYECLKYFSGPLEPIGTVGIPLFIIMIFLSLPFIDKSPERDPLKRGFVMSCGFLFITFVIGMTFQGYYGSPPQDEQARTRLEAMKETDKALTRRGIQGFHGVRPIKPQTAETEEINGEKLFNVMGCAVCHSVNGKPGGKEGPDLRMVLNRNVSRDWLWVQLVSPQNHNPQTVMPGYAHLSNDQLNALINYLQGLVADKPATSVPDAVIAGEKLFNTLRCVDCHTASGTASGKKGPDLIMSLGQKNISEKWLYAQLVNPQKHNLSTIMPSYTKLDNHQLKILVAFLKDLSTRDPKSKPSKAKEASRAGSESRVPQPDLPEQNGSAGLGLGQAIHIVGNREHGTVLYHQHCMRCHGPEGKVNRSDASVLPGVPFIAPIRRELFSKNPVMFVQNIDPMIQHGAKNRSSGPAMPPYGDTHELTQAQIADIEAYVLHLNGVDRTGIIHPGMDPQEFFYLLFKFSVLFTALLGIYGWFVRSHRERN